MMAAAHPAMGGNRGKDVRARGRGPRAYWHADYAVHLTHEAAKELDVYRAWRDDDDEDDEATARAVFVQAIEAALTDYRLMAQHEADTPLPSAPGAALDLIASQVRALMLVLDETADVLQDVWHEPFRWPTVDDPHGRLSPYDLRAFRHALDGFETAVWARRTALGPASGGRPPTTARDALIETLATIYDEQNGDSSTGRGRLTFVSKCAKHVGVRLSKHVRERLRSRKPPPRTE